VSQLRTVRPHLVPRFHQHPIAWWRWHRLLRKAKRDWLALSGRDRAILDELYLREEETILFGEDTARRRAEMRGREPMSPEELWG
jgi:hypothetical protein